MSGVVRDVAKHVGAPVKKVVIDNQKKLRKGVVRLIDVADEQKKKTRDFRDEDKSDGSFKKEEDLFSLASLRHWDVDMPPEKRKKFGFVPGVKSTINKVGFGKVFNKKRRITIELYKKITPKQAAKNKEQERRVFQKLYARASMADTPMQDVNRVSPLGDDDFIIFRILKEKKSGGAYDAMDFFDDNSQSTASHHPPNGTLESHMLTTYNVTDYGDGQKQSDLASHWKERHRSRISTIEINHVESEMVELQLGVGNNVKVRQFFFHDSHEVETFVKTFDMMRELMYERGSRMAAEQRIHMGIPVSNQTKEKSERQNKDRGTKRGGFFNSLGFGTINEEPITDSVNLLIEIVSATDLPIADTTTSDPYVRVEDGRKQLHKTGVVSNTLHPVWTLSTDSMFLIQTNLSDFFELASQIEFVVTDYDSVGANDTLGSCLVSKKDLMEGNGERVEFVLNTSKYGEENDILVGKKKSYLTLRFKNATEDEISFIRSYEAKKEIGLLSALGLSHGVTGVFAEDCNVLPRLHPSTVWKRNERKTKDEIAVKYRLKPFADPSRPEAETKWMTERDIQGEFQKPSRDWIEAGSGHVGKFYIEILGCDGLPNLDVSLTGRNKSDPFVNINFEDSTVNTDVINDCLAPRWMPWTQRAFVFNVMHPSSQFYIAVMDYEGIKSHHDKIGRCIVNPTNLRPNTQYTMRYNLLDSDEIDRKTRGKIMFRLRFESSSERQFLLSTFQWRKDYSISTNDRSDSKTINYALTNDHNIHVLSLEMIQKYLDELIEYQLYLEDIIYAFKVVILWRGHFPLTISCFKKSFTVKAPFHSLTAFTWGILLSFDFDRFGSFICFAFAWFLFATLELQRSNPNPWKRPRTYIDLLGTLIFNKSFAHQRIEANENIEEIMAFDERRADQMKFRKETIETAMIRNERDLRRVEIENKEVDKQAYDKKLALYGPSRLYLGPFQEILVPVQKILYNACIYCRFAKSIMVWSDSVVAFWVATVALLLSAFLFFVPWTFLFRWTFRILVVVFTGPWMKLVDIFFIENVAGMNIKQRKAKKEAEMQEHYDFLIGDSRIKRKYKERKMKKRDMERYMFGQYGMRVPIFKEERFASVPLMGGTAEPYDPTSTSPPNIVRRINGQFLKGDMVMQRQNPAKEFKEQSNFIDLDLRVPAVISMKSFPTKDESEPLLNDGNDDAYPYGSLEV